MTVTPSSEDMVEGSVVPMLWAAASPASWVCRMMTALMLSPPCKRLCADDNARREDAAEIVSVMSLTLTPSTFARLCLKARRRCCPAAVLAE